VIELCIRPDTDFFDMNNLVVFTKNKISADSDYRGLAYN
jgi:5'-3' exonuclease